MSDPQALGGEPITESTPVADVVTQAHEGLAVADAARQGTMDTGFRTFADAAGRRVSRDAGAPEPGDRSGAADEPVFSTPELNAAHAADAAPAGDASPAGESPAERSDAEGAGAEQPDAHGSDSGEPAAADEAPTEAQPAASGSSAPPAAAPAPDRLSPDTTPDYAPVAQSAQYQPQPVFVQAPEEPRPHGNRGAAGGIGLVATLCFAVLYLGAALLIGLVTGTVDTAGVTAWLTRQLMAWGLWVPVAVFFIAFWILGAFVNRARWGYWAVFGLLVGLAAYGGHILGQLFDGPFWMISSAEVTRIVDQQLFAPLAIAALVIGRELTIWFGAWAAAHGKKVTARNIDERNEYERTLEAGPQLPG